jgi:transcriptional regulator with XRE-family HTH domain
MRDLFALREADGLTYRELSELSGVPQGTLSWWAAELRRRDGVASPRFVEVVLESGAAADDADDDPATLAPDADAASGVHDPSDATIEFTVTLRCGHRVAVPAGYGLARLVRELAAC